MPDYSFTIATYPPPSPDLPYLVVVLNRLNNTVMQSFIATDAHHAATLAREIAGEAQAIVDGNSTGGTDAKGS